MNDGKIEKEIEGEKKGRHIPSKRTFDECRGQCHLKKGCMMDAERYLKTFVIKTLSWIEIQHDQAENDIRTIPDFTELDVWKLK